MDLKSKILKLEKQIARLISISETRDELLLEAWNRIEELEQENKELKFLVHKPTKKAVKKHSQNSDLPPSKDNHKPKKNQSLRNKSGKSKGGQEGHKGHFLKMSPIVDQTIELKLNNCPECQGEITSYKKLSVRQEVYLPKIEAKYREYQQFACTCDKCNKSFKTSYPEHIKAPIQYGKDIVAINAYLSAYQLIPFKRTKELFRDLMGLEICQATLKNQLTYFNEAAESTYEQIRAFIAKSKVIGSDETTARVNGALKWIWTFQNQFATYLCCEDRRNFEVITKHFPKQFPNAIYVSDQYNAQMKVEAKAHQVCWAHLLRKCNYLKEAEHPLWPNQVKQLFYDARKLKQKYQQIDPNSPLFKNIDQQLNKLLLQTIDKDSKETLKLQKSLFKHKYHLFNFLLFKDVPPDNNASERAIRNVKVKLKISGQFIQTQHIYCRIRSIIDTCIKNTQPILDNLTNVALQNKLLFNLT